MQGQRGTFLSVLLVVNAAAITLASIALVVDRDIQNAIGGLPAWFDTFVIALLLARLVALWGIWSWSRWGVYAYLLLECIELGMGLFVFTAFLTPLRALGGTSTFLVLLAIYYLALKPKWQLFR